MLANDPPYPQLCKALLVRSHPRALPAIDRLFEVFGDATIGTDAAKAFGDIAAADGVLTKRNAAVVRVRLRLRAMCDVREERADFLSVDAVLVGAKVRDGDVAAADGRGAG
jgi:hypothetical protein